MSDNHTTYWKKKDTQRYDNVALMVYSRLDIITEIGAYTQQALMTNLSEFYDVQTTQPKYVRLWFAIMETLTLNVNVIFVRPVPNWKICWPFDLNIIDIPWILARIS